jgi:ligand-binding sensor domain-containing protein
MNNKLSMDLIPVTGIFRKISFFIFVLLLTIILSPFVNSQSAVPVIPLGEEILSKRFYSSTIDDDNTIWFLTEKGIVSFNGIKWALHNKNRKVTSNEMKGVAYDYSSYGPELWIATPQGATVVSVPVDAKSGATTYYLDNSKIMSENVLAVVVGKKELRWFGTDKGISAFRDKKWLTNSYLRKYPDGTFQDFQITSLATSFNGDSLYIGTLGGGVLRVYRNDVDVVSGASEYAAWGPILMPSDSVYCIHLSADGAQWFGTDKGVAKHNGYKTLEGWSIITTDEGLADNFVQAINSDAKGNIYFGTKNGLSVFDGSEWRSFKVENGLASNNILTIAVDKKGLVWIGTDNGVTSLKDGKFTVYR